MDKWIIVTLAAIVACVTTLVMTPVSMKLSLTLGAVDKPGGRHIHETPTPRMGGIAIFAGAVIPLVIAGLLIGRVGLGITSEMNILGILASAAVVFASGCIDDVRGLNPKAKLTLQIAAAIIAAASGALVSDIRAYDGTVIFMMGWLSWPATIIYLVAFCNIVNLIDGLDGLAAGVVGIASVGLIGVSWMTGNIVSALICSCLFGACLGFLKYNFHPAKTFMGDSGSLFLGFLLGLASLVGTMKVSTITSVAVPIIIAGVPVLDTFAAIVRRMRGHVPLDSPDAGHIHHTLLNLGYDQRSVVLRIYCVCAICAASGFLIANSGFTARVICVAIDLLVAFLLIWKLELFEPVLMRLYPQGMADFSEGCHLGLVRFPRESLSCVNISRPRLMPAQSAWGLWRKSLFHVVTTFMFLLLKQVWTMHVSTETFLNGCIYTPRSEWERKL